MRWLSSIAVCTAAIALGGCMPIPTPYTANNLAIQQSPNTLTIFQDSRGPVSYQAAAGLDVGKQLPTTRVKGRACQHSVAVPILASAEASFGSLGVVLADGSYRQAVQDALGKAGPGSLLFDVRADVSHLVVLGIYMRRCVHIDAAVVPPGAAVPAAAPEPAPQPAAEATTEPTPAAEPDPAAAEETPADELPPPPPPPEG